MQKPNSDKPKQAKTTVDQTRWPRTASLKKMGAVGPTGRRTDLQVGRLDHGPHHLSQATCHLLVDPLGRFGESHPVAPCYKYKGGRD
jgi:hypothetical protein